MNRKFLVLGAVTLAGLVFAEAKPILEPGNFRFTRAVQTREGAGVFRVDLPESVYAGVAHDDLRDVRVFNHDGIAVPASFQRNEREQVLRTQTDTLTFYPVMGDAKKTYEGASRVAMSEGGGQRSVVVEFGDAGKSPSPTPRGYLVDLRAKEQPLRRIELDWTDGGETGFFTVKAEGSDDLTNWRPLAAPTALARFRFGQNLLERKTIELPDVRAKYVLLTWSETPALPVKALRGEFAESAWIEPQRHTTRVTTARQGTSDYLFAKMPVLADQLAVALPESNTLVRVDLASRPDEKAPWQPRASALLYRITVDGREIQSEPLTFPPSPDRFWKLHLVGDDASLGAKPPEVEFRWIAHQLFFVAQGAGPFLLAYGQPKAQAADFGVASVTGAFGADGKVTPALAALGPEVAQNAVEPSAAPVPGEASPAKKYALWALLVGGILLTALMAVKLLRDLKPQ